MVNPVSFFDRRNKLIENSRAVADTPSDVILVPGSRGITLNLDTTALFAGMARDNVHKSEELSLLAPDKNKIVAFHSRDKFSSKKFWAGLTNTIKFELETNTKDYLEDYRASHEFTEHTVATYLSLYFGMRGDTSMLQFFCEVAPAQLHAAASAFPDVLIRGEGSSVGQTQGLGKSPPSVASCKLLVKLYAKRALLRTEGSERLKAIEHGASLITRFLADRRGLGKYLGKYEKKAERETLDEELQKAINATRPNLAMTLSDENVPFTSVEAYFLSSKSDVLAMFQDVRTLFKELVPSDEQSVGKKEYQAICVAILAVGISNFGYEMVKRYETIQKRAAKITELVGAILGMEPHAGTIVTAVATVSKAITDAVYEHKADKAKVIKTLGKRITAAFLLNTADLKYSDPWIEGEASALKKKDGEAMADSMLYTRILSSIYGIAL